MRHDRFRRVVAVLGLFVAAGCADMPGPLRSAAFEELCEAAAAKPDAAIQGCTLALERLDPAAPDYKAARAALLANRGAAAAAAGRHEAALRDQNEALALNPDPAISWANRGWTLIALGRPREALVDFEAALERDPNLSRARLGRGSAFLAASAPARAVPDLEAAVEVETHLAFARLQLARAYADLGRTEEAAAAYSFALSLAPRDIDALLERARLREGADRSGAQADYDAAVRLGVDPGRAFFERGRFFDRIGDAAAADADLERAYTLGYDDPWLNERLRRRPR